MATRGDHFSGVADAYARFRPHYPEALFRFLLAQVPAPARVWDAGTGSGQAAVALARLGAQVTATDVSAAQIAAAGPHPRVCYGVAPAESSGLPDASVDLVTVAQALHWFDLARFTAEVTRVLRPGGVLAVWTYGRFETDDGRVQAVLDRFYDEVVGPYWPPERALVEVGYQGVLLPFAPVEAPAFALTAMLPLEGVVGYAGTWSATQACARAVGDPLPAFRGALAEVWGDPATAREVRWPLALRVTRRPDVQPGSR